MASPTTQDSQAAANLDFALSHNLSQSSSPFPCQKPTEENGLIVWMSQEEPTSFPKIPSTDPDPQLDSLDRV